MCSISRVGDGVYSGANDSDNLANFKNRLKNLEEKVTAEGLILTESLVQALERKKLDDEACGEIETAHPGDLGSQDTFYVATLKGVGDIYQKTFVDIYSRIAQCKLYTTKTPITAADLLDDKVLPFFESEGLPKKIYNDIESLQAELDEWLIKYNTQRTHQGKMCCGRTPMETLEDGKQIWKEKFIA